MSPRLLKPGRIGTVIDFPQIGDPKPTFREFVQIAKRINREAGLNILGQLNLMLSIAAIKEDLESDADIRWKTQELLIGTTISQPRLNQLKRRLAHDHLRDRVIFHRRQLL